MISNRRSIAPFLPLVVALIVFGCAPRPVVRQKVESPKPPPAVKIAFDQKLANFRTAVARRRLPFLIPEETKIDSVNADSATGIVSIDFSRQFSYLPFRREDVEGIHADVKRFFGADTVKYSFLLRCLLRPIEQLVPNYYQRDSTGYDRSRMPRPGGERPEPVVRNISKPFVPARGLAGRNIVLWPSHGWHYNEDRARWEWQRPRLFLSVEDKISLALTLPYLVPMLENAGANVFIPRERDLQTHEVVVDNDTRRDVRSKAYREAGRGGVLSWKPGGVSGFAYGTPPYKVDYNPFLQGTHRVVSTSPKPTARATWVPRIPEAGYYAVYVSYAASPANATDARYTVFHEGGQTEFLVNQQIGGNTWEYLGEFKFREGSNPSAGKVVLTNQSAESGTIVSADAVRFGGGMGVVERGGSASGRPKFLEASKYYLQYAGMPDTLVYNFNRDTNDYNDDFKCRPEYVNYLRGAPDGPNKDRSVKGLGIPVDLSLALHTDAGIARGDSTIGTLSIYSIDDADSLSAFPDGMSRWANRDLADIVQSQVVNDIRARYYPGWTRRELRDSRYAETLRPNVPSMLIEVLSHQNFKDMKFLLDPRFRFDVARAIYKGMLRFLSVQNGTRYVIQPLPVTHFTSAFGTGGEIVLRWRPQVDSLEPAAVPDSYVVYTRMNDGGFDNGQVVEDPVFVMRNVRPGVIYSFRIGAVNAGGESASSEILSACAMGKGRDVALIVNGFTRVSGPASVETAKFSGFLEDIDAGVADRYGINFTGGQLDFDPSSSYNGNDAPGFGASGAEEEAEVLAGNTFDYPYLHGLSLRASGYSFVSASVGAVMDTVPDLTRYSIMDLILGAQKETHWPAEAADSMHGTAFAPFPAELQLALRRYCEAGGSVFLSGASLGAAQTTLSHRDSATAEFERKTLKFAWITDRAARRGGISPASTSPLPHVPHMAFMTERGKDVYAVTPGSPGPANGSETILRYDENQFSAATAYKGPYGIVVFGFPFETIVGRDARDAVMKAVLDYLRRK